MAPECYKYCTSREKNKLCTPETCSGLYYIDGIPVYRVDAGLRRAPSNT